MKPQSAKAKGRAGQQEIKAKLLKKFDHLEEDDVRSTAMGQSGEDIQLSPLARKSIPLSIEVKRRKALSAPVYDWYEQAKQDGKYEPVVFFRGDFKEWLAIVDADHYIDLIENQTRKERKE